MSANASEDAVIRFDTFEMELKSGELRRDGALIKLPPQPFRALAFLAARAGQVVTREEIQREIWGDETFVDYEQGVNFCIKRIRAALGDDAQAPRFIETLPRRGYRFIAPVERSLARKEGDSSRENGLAVTPPGAVISTTETAPYPPAVPAPRTRTVAFLIVALVAAVTLAAGYVIWQKRREKSIPPAGKIILAVLPFENLSGDPGQDYFSDGLTEEMITRLGRLQPQRLGVIARASAMTFKKSNKDIARIGGALGANYILEGGVRREADRLRITAKLIQVSDQTHLWADAYDRQIHDALAVQTEVADRIAQSLAVKLLPGPASAQTYIPSPDSYDAYLRGRYLRNKWTREDLEKGVSRFEQAVEKDPGFALAYASLAESWRYLQFLGGARPQDARAKTKNAALKAVALDNTLAEAHAALASARFWYDWDWQEAEQEFNIALALNPSLAGAHHDYGWLLIARERFDEGLAEVKRAQELDPLSPQSNVDVGWACIRARRYDEAIAQSRRTMELEPNYAEAWGCLMRAYQYKGKFAEAIAEAQRIMTRSGASREELDSVRQGDAASGMRIVEQWMLNRMKKAAGHGYVSGYQLATRYAALEEKESAFEWLETAYADRDPMMALLNTDPEYDRLRAEPRFGDLLRRIRIAAQSDRPQ